jgi:hypothetical protein
MALALRVRTGCLRIHLKPSKPFFPANNTIGRRAGTFVCNWALGQCDRMPPQVLLAFEDALAGDASVNFVFEVVQA